MGGWAAFQFVKCSLNTVFQLPNHYQPIFDTSKGYEIELTNSGRASLPPPLDQLLNVFSARVVGLNAYYASLG